MKRALFIGRFQPFHNAHLADVKKILKECDEILIAVGSSQEKNTEENPFSYNERKQMIGRALRNNNVKNYKIYPMPDLYNDKKWISYIRKNLPKFDVVYSGNKWTLRCFRKHDSKIKKIKLVEGISSTIVRNNILNEKEWKKLVPKEIASYIQKIRGVERIKNLS